jgi:hypothetical protein
MTDLQMLAKPLVNSVDLQGEKLQEYYTFRNRREVTDFIEKYPFLLEVLEGAPGEISKYFPGARLELEYYVDPEYSTEHPGDLVLHIKTYENQLLDSKDLLDEIDLNEPSEELDRLNNLDENWGWDAYDRCQHKFFIVLS